MKRLWPVLALVVLFVGCFPITVSVAPDGRIALVREEGVIVYDLKALKATVVAKAEEGNKAAWVQFSRDGSKLCYVLSDGDTPKRLFVSKPDGTDVKKIYTSDNPMAWAVWSPDGKYISVGEVSNESNDDLPNLVDLKIVDASTGKAKKLSGNTMPIHAWLGDSSGVVALVAESKAQPKPAKKPKEGEGEGEDQGGGGQESKALRGKLVKFTPDGTKTELAAAIFAQDMCIDGSHDGKEVIFTASAAGALGAELAVPAKPDQQKLFLLALAGKDVKEISAPAVQLAFYSPDDKHLLIGRAGEKKTLLVSDRAGAGAKVVATDVLDQTPAMPPTRMLAQWLSNDTVIYWRSHVTIGMGGASIDTMTVKLDGTAKTSLQTKLDSLLEK